MIDALLVLLVSFFSSGLSSRYCSQPAVPENCHVIFPTLGPYEIGTKAKYNCAVGYIHLGPEERECLPDGTWSAREPVCAVNVGLYKPTTQSTTVVTESIPHFANYSTDGSLDGICSTTLKEKLPWWSVDLLETFEIYAVEILFTDASIRKTRKIEIVVEPEDDGRPFICYSQNPLSDEKRLRTFYCDRAIFGRYVTITSEDVSLQMCEVFILSPSAASSWQCRQPSDGMVVMGLHKAFCYTKSTDEQKLPWKSAQARCLQDGGSLPLRLDFEQKLYLKSQLQHRADADFYWIGLMVTAMAKNHSAAPQKWKWADGMDLREEVSDWADNSSSTVPVDDDGGAFAVVMSQMFDWKWLPATQSVWNSWICQSKPHFCASPGVAVAGQVVFSSQTYAIGTTAYYSCERGHTLNSETDGRRECLETGRWSGNIPNCTLNCGRPNGWNEGHWLLINKTTTFLSLAKYECTEGKYLLNGANIRVCEADGRWSGETPSCADIDCGNLENPGNGTVQLKATIFNSLVKYRCNEGFKLVGASERRCSKFGSWSPDAPLCYDLLSFRKLFAPEMVHSTNQNLMLALFIAMAVVVVFVSMALWIVWKRRKHPDSFSLSTLYAPPTTYTSTSGSKNAIYAVSGVRPFAEHRQPPSHRAPSPPTSLQNSSISTAETLYATGKPSNYSSHDSIIYYASSSNREVVEKDEGDEVTELEIPPHLLKMHQLPNGNIHVTLPCPRSNCRRPSLPPGLINPTNAVYAPSTTGGRSPSTNDPHGWPPLPSKRLRSRKRSEKFQTMISNVRNKLANELKTYASGGTVSSSNDKMRRRLSPNDIVLLGPVKSSGSNLSELGVVNAPISRQLDIPRLFSNISPTPSEILYTFDDDDFDEDTESVHSRKQQTCADKERQATSTNSHIDEKANTSTMSRNDEPLYDSPPELLARSQPLKKLCLKSVSQERNENYYEELTSDGKVRASSQAVNTLC